ARVPVQDLDRRNNVRLDPASDVALDSIAPRPRAAVLFIEPAHESGSREAGRIDSEISFDGLQRGRAATNQAFENWRQQRAFEELPSHRPDYLAGQIALVERFFKIGAEPPPR